MKTVYVACHLYLEAGPTYQIAEKKIDGVKIGTVYTKWGNLDENLLNGVIAVKIIKLRGKNWNLL
jgi:hypothetical protein